LYRSVTTDIYTLSLHDALPIYADVLLMWAEASVMTGNYVESDVYNAIDQIRQRPDVMMPKVEDVEGPGLSAEALLKVIKHERRIDRKSTRLNSSHVKISYAVFC